MRFFADNADYRIAKRNSKERIMMQPHEERVVTEKRELEEKLARLKVFILEPNPIFRALAPEDRDLLEDQYTAMKQYSAILEKRIGRFPRAAAGDQNGD